MSMTITIGELQSAIREELKTYSEEVAEGVKNAVDETAAELLENTRRDAPKRENGGDYARAMRLKTEFESATEKRVKWFVGKPMCNLSHLLEDGHKIFVGTAEEKTGKRRGTKQIHRQGGTVRAYPHIKHNEEKAKQDFRRRTEEVIQHARH